MSVVASIVGVADVVAQTTITGYSEPAPWGYVIAGWASVVAIVGGYTGWAVVKGRKLARQLPPDERRWMG